MSKINLIKRLNSDKRMAKNVLVIGVFHGDEEQGEFLINSFLDECGEDSPGAYPEKDAKADTTGKNNVFYIPRLNSAKTRVNKNGVDLNRNFPTKNWGEDTSKAGENASDYYGGPCAASEEETKFIVSLMENTAFDAIITLHSPYKIVNYDGDREGEALKLAQKISEITGYPVEEDIGYPTPGSFGTYAGKERDIPTITIEMAEDVPVKSLYPKFKRLFEYLENEY